MPNYSEGKDLSNNTQIRVITEPNGAWDMHRNAKNVELKPQSKISCRYAWLLHGKKIPRLDDAFLEVFKCNQA